MNKPTPELPEESIYMPEQLPENNKPDNRPVISSFHGKLRGQFYQSFYVCVPDPNHYPEGCICEFTDEQIEPVIEWFAKNIISQQLTAYSEKVYEVIEKYFRQKEFASTDEQSHFMAQFVKKTINKEIVQALSNINKEWGIIDDGKPVDNAI